MKQGMGWAASGLTLVCALGLAGVAAAQDTRQVDEPKIPASCVQLPAALQAVGGKVAPEDEGKLDTVRIQKALDGCKPGMAVELKPMTVSIRPTPSVFCSEELL